MGVGRFACVALPFALTVCSVICIMIAMLAGIANKNLDMFSLDTANLSVSTSTLLNIVNLTQTTANGLGGLTTAAQGPTPGNITAADLGLAQHYKVSLWNYCSVTDSKQNCTKGKWNWASEATDTTEMRKIVAAKTNYNNATLPKELKGSLETFQKVHKWTSLVYIIAIISGGFTLFLGIFSIFSKAASCVTYIVSGVASTSLIIASSMATAEVGIIVGAIKTVRKSYNVDAHINGSWLSVTWIAVAFSLGAGLFWMFTICCCSSSSHSSKKGGRRSRGMDDAEKLIPTGSYQRVDDQHHFNNGHGGGAFSHGAAGVPMKPLNRGNGAYEPYSHAAI